MDEHIDYQVLAPDSVAWYIQAALVADRTGNVAARDMALAEAQRVAEERRLVEPCYDCRTNQQRIADRERRVEGLTMALGACALSATVHGQGERLAALEGQLNRLVLFAGSDKEMKDFSVRLAALEERQPNDAYIQMHGQRLADIERRLAALEGRQERTAMAEDETLLTVDMDRVYDMIAERLAGGA